MKKVILSVAILFAVGFTSCKNDNKQKEETTEISKEITTNEISFGVRGNCGMCKNTIEKAVKEVEGISEATWNKDKKMIEVSFDSSKTDEMAIHKVIAASGYDTEKVAGNEEAYKNLPECCKYDHEMEMNIE
jgi:copper chaperone CopZ